MQWFAEGEDDADAVCGTQGSARDEAQTSCSTVSGLILYIRLAAAGVSQACFMAVVEEERDITEIGQVRSRHIKMKEYRSVRIYGSSLPSKHRAKISPGIVHSSPYCTAVLWSFFAVALHSPLKS